jgi:hypothetical protein
LADNSNLVARTFTVREASHEGSPHSAQGITLNAVMLFASPSVTSIA